MAKLKTVKVNMKGVETGAVLVPEGDYEAKVESVEVAESETSGSEYLKWTLKIVSDENKGAKLYHMTSLQPQALFNLKGVLISLGVVVPEAEFELDFEDLKGRVCGVTVAHEKYDGKNRARITDFYPLDQLESGGEDSEVDLESLELPELLEFAEENDITITAKIKKSKAKVLAAIQAATEADEEPADEEKGDGDGEEEVDLDELDLKGLKALAAENDIDIPKAILKNEAKIRALLEKELGEEEPEEPDKEESDEEIDLASMDLKELKSFAAENDITIPTKISKNLAKIRELIEAELDDAAEAEQEVDLDAMSLKELISFAAENDITLSKKAKASETIARKVIKANMDDDEE